MNQLRNYSMTKAFSSINYYYTESLNSFLIHLLHLITID